MRRWWYLVVAVVLVSAVPASAADWRVDQAHSSLNVVFDVGGKPITGSFGSFAAKIRFDPAKPGEASAEINVDLASFRSGDAQRDQMAAAGEFLATASHPTAAYRTTAFTAKGGDHYEVAGVLTLKGMTGSFSHPATITVSGKEAHAIGELTLNRVDFGVGAAQFPRGDQVGLAVTVHYDLVASRAG